MTSALRGMVRGSLLAISLTWGFAGCAANGSGSAAATHGSSGPLPSSGTATGTARVVLSIPGGTVQARARRPAFVSSGTNGMEVVVRLHSTQAALAASAVDLSSGSSACTASGAARTCTILLPAPPTPVGDSDDIALTTYDQAPVGGSFAAAHQLATASDLQQQIVAGSKTTITFTLDGTPASLSYADAAVAFPVDQGQFATLDPITVHDASGAVIVGAFSQNITVRPASPQAHLSFEIGAGSPSSSVVLTSSSDASSFDERYDGQAPAPFSATIGDFDDVGISGTSTVATIGVSGTAGYQPGMPPSLVFAQVGQVVTLTATEPGLSAGFSQASTCPANVATFGPFQSTSTPGMQTLAVTAGSVAGQCTLTITDGNGWSYVPVSIVLGPALTIIIPTPPSATPTPAPTPIPSPTPAPGRVVVSPNSLSFSAPGQTASVSVTESGYGGAFAATSANSGIAAVTPSTTNGTLTVTAGTTSGSTTITVSDTNGNSAPLGVVVTITNGVIDRR